MPTIQRLFNLFLIAFCGSWLLFKTLAGPFLIFLIVLAVFGLLRKENQIKFQVIQSTWILLFIFYISSLFWANTPDWSALERKLALFAFPLLFSFKWNKPLPIAQMWLAHTIGCLVLIIIAYYDALMCTLSHGNSVRCFSTTYFSQLHHPSYFSAFLIFAIIGLLFQKVAWFASKPRWLSWLIILLFAGMHIHLGSLAGIITLCFILVIFAVKSSMVYLGKLRGIIAGIFILLTSIAVALSSKDIRADAQNAADFTKHFIANPTKFVENRKEPLQGNEVRLILWTASVQLGIEHPMGLGLGGLEPALAKKLKQWGYPKQAEKEFNPHNQFLQVWNEIGLVGLFFFICLLYLLFMDFYSKKELSKLLLLIAFIIYCLFESFLQRASGIVFFLCWFTVLSYLPKKTLQ